MAYCCVPGCDSYQKRECDRYLSFHRFPTDPPTRQAWIDKITMLEEYVDPYFQVTGNNKVCSKHFKEDCRVTSVKGLKTLKKGSVPTLFTGCRPLTRWTIQAPHRDPQSVQVTKATTTEIEKETLSYEAPDFLRDHDYSKTPPTVKEQLQAAQTALDHLAGKSRALKSERFFLQRFQYEPEVIMFYTGFKDYDTLKAFYLALQPTPETIWRCSHAVRQNNTEHISVDAGFSAQHLCLFDQLFLFLCCVRRGFLPVDMSKRFQVSEAAVQTTCVAWCHYLFFMLSTLPIWPSRCAVDEQMPPFFRTTFPKTRVMLDLAQIHIQIARGSTTLKSLFGITPSGSVCLLSRVYTASISDRDIIRESGVLNLLESGDQVMADERLEIEDLLDVIGVDLVTPSGRLHQEDATHIRDLETHIARATTRVKDFHLFDDVVPAALCGSVNQLWAVCALLTNFQGAL